jgi:hypothetical protein
MIKSTLTLDERDALEKIYDELCALELFTRDLDGVDTHTLNGLCFFIQDIAAQIGSINRKS